MISALAIVLGGSSAACIVAILLLVRRNDELTGLILAEGKARLEAERGQLQAEKVRDSAVERAAAAEESTARAFAQLTAAQRKANAAREELTKHVEKQIAGSAADVAAVVDGLLQARLPGAADAAKPAAAGDGASGAGAVSASAIAAADKIRRLPKP